jgi:hypothetical protein
MSINRTWQRKVLTAAAADGTLGELYWYPVEVSGRHDRAVTVGDAAPAIPVIPVAPDPEISRHHAHLMIALMELRGAAFALDLTTAALLDQVGVPWFVFGEHDHICPSCAAVNGDCVCVPMREVAAVGTAWG